MGNAANITSTALASGKAAAVGSRAARSLLFLSIPEVAAAVLMAAGSLVIAGWILNIEVVKSLSPSWATMKVNTAVLFVLCGFALDAAGHRKPGFRRAGSIAAVIVLVLALATLVQHASGMNFGIDELLMQQPTTAADTARPGRMSGATAVGFILLALALLCLVTDKTMSGILPVALAAAVSGICCVAVLGYLHDVNLLYAVRPFSSMSLHSALLFGVAGAGIFAARSGSAREWGRRAHALAAAKEAFRRRVLFEQSRDGIVVFDADRNVYEANESFAKLLGCTVDEVLSLNPWDWDVKYYNRELFMEEWPRMPKVSGELETQFRRRDGSVIDVAVSYTPASFDGTDYLYCNCRDVTAQKQADQTLHESEERFRRALANIPDVVVIYDPELRIRYINSATRAVTGLGSADFIGRRDDEIFPPEVYSAYLPTLEDALQSKLIRKVEFDVRLPKVGTRTLRVICVPILDKDGEVREIVGVTRDLTEGRAAEARIRQSEQQYRELIEQAAAGIFISDADGKFLLANSRCCELLGYDQEELLALDGRETYLGEETSTTTRRMALLVAGQDLRYERMLKRRDGSSFPAEISVKMLDSGGMQVIFHDITERHRQERKIARLSRIHAVLSGINSTIVRVRDRRELFREACRIAVDSGKFEIAWIATLEPGHNKARILAHFGLPVELFAPNAKADAKTDPVVDLMPNGPVSFSLQERRPVYENDIAQSPHLSKVRRLAVRQGAKSVISLPLLVEGEVFGFLVLYAPERNFFDDEELKLLQGLAGDISFALEFIAKGERVNYLAYYDTLTGLPNRSLFFDALNRQLGAAKSAGNKVALQLFDVDRFRMINDTYGRDGADRMIGDIAERLRSCVGVTDTIARVGPDSFAVGISGAWQAEQAAHAFEELDNRVFGRPFVVDEEELRVSATSGVAVFPGDGADAAALLSNAEAAQRDAEKKNLKFLFYSSDMNERVADSIRLENRLRHALEQDRIVMWYQPKLAVESGRLTGFEALMRWEDRERGELVQPSVFIPIMEQTGLILDAGQRALRKVASDCSAWKHTSTLPLSIAVNVSLMQLNQPDFVSSVVEAHRFLQNAGWILELELTESVVMEDPEAIIPKLERLRELGVLMSVDDFGTGYSSLAYISRLPIHCLKIDRSFVFGMTEDQNSLGIVKSIISLAHSLGLTVVAEGVETGEQVQELGRLQCDEMQGFRISKAVAPDAVPGLIRQLG